MWAQVSGSAVTAVNLDAPAEGWVEVRELERPADTITQTWAPVVTVQDGQPVRSWVPRDWTAEELEAMSPERRTLLTALSNEEALRERARQALTANAAYLALSTPTAAQVAAQVRSLTQQTNALIRLAVGALDSIN